MRTGSLILGSYLLITGIVMLVFHKPLKRSFDDLLSGIPEGLRQLPRGRSMTVMIIMTGVLSVTGGLALLVLYFVNR